MIIVRFIKSLCFIRQAANIWKSQATTPVKNQGFKDTPFVPALIVYSD
jgi:hypothetical protein